MCNFLIQYVIVSLFLFIYISELITVSNWLHHFYLLKRNLDIYLPVNKLLSINQKLSYQAYKYLFNSVLQKDNQYFSTKSKHQV